MATWLYQLSVVYFTPQQYRTEIWEGERWRWPVGDNPPKTEVPAPGDQICFYYAKTNNPEPGFYGWAIVLEWRTDSSSPLYFRPTSPSDHLKMDPWGDGAALALADSIRGKMPRKSLYQITPEDVPNLRQGVARWLARGV
jgi:hypothetical protein